MRIGFLVPPLYCFANASNGVRAQAEAQIGALRSLGHDVATLSPWDHYDGRKFDVVHFVLGGFPFFGIGVGVGRVTRTLAFAPIIDSNEPNWRYRLACRLGRIVPKVYTIPGEFRRQADAAQVVICRSRFEQDRVVYGLGVDRAKTRIVLNGVTPPPPADASLAWRLLGSDAPFVFHVSTYAQTRKNVVRLIEAVGPTGLPLVIAGTAEPSATLDRIQHLENRFPNVIRLGFLTPDERNALFAACRVFALPSLHEGTGLAALEAASYGAHVVITERGGTRDYFQDHAAYVNPYDVAAIRRAVTERFARPRTTQFAEYLKTRLTWQASARQLTDAYGTARTD